MNDTDALRGSILSLIAEDKDLIVYRKSLRRVAGSVTATILLQQMIHRLKDRDRIYKFKIPCDHELYRDGDSWNEELGFSIKEFDTALKKIGTKLSKGRKKEDVLRRLSPNAIVIYWTDRNRVTWYELNKPLLNAYFCVIYLNDQPAFSNITEEDLLKYLPKGYLHDLTESPTESPTETGGENPPAPPPNSFTDLFPEKAAPPNGSTKPTTPVIEHEVDLWFANAANTSEPEDAALRQIEAVWQKKRIAQDTKLAMAAYHLSMLKRNPNLEIPRDKTTQGKWAAGVKDHLDNYSLADLKRLYPLAIKHAQDREWEIYSPQSLTLALAKVSAQQQPAASATSYKDDPQYKVFLSEDY